ncbi:MAG: tRNA (adenosine(37)-N6)-threonylcarbamoyltransferase complex ATPase subunit type 1 TsaE, partial [Alphaproteobacteria bacterium]
MIALAGALGTGKTTLARDLIEALAGAPCEVPSPTFTLVQTYELEPLTVWHFDLYRVEHPEEAIELGLEDALA